MTKSEREELEKQAQQKLTDARRLINEAGDLAKQGQFHLHFGEIGDFIPESAIDPDKLRPLALEEAQREGRTVWASYDYKRTSTGERVPDYNTDEYRAWQQAGCEYFVIRPEVRTKWEDLDEDEREVLVESIMGSMKEDLPYEFREYAGPGDGDRWWHPSRC